MVLALCDSEVSVEGRGEPMWLRCGGVAENKVITVMSGSCQLCLEEKRKRRTSKTERNKGRRLSEWQGGGNERSFIVFTKRIKH